VHHAVGKHDFEEDERKFREMEFDRVYPPNINLKVVLEDLKNDLKKKGKS
jgi:methylmalonyl-CoA mutase cobalamin-binding subunit